MNWQNAEEFFAMGGHGLYVWLAYGAALALLLTEACLAVARRRRALAMALQESEHEEKP